MLYLNFTKNIQTANQNLMHAHIGTAIDLSKNTVFWYFTCKLEILKSARWKIIIIIIPNPKSKFKKKKTDDQQPKM